MVGIEWFKRHGVWNAFIFPSLFLKLPFLCLTILVFTKTPFAFMRYLLAFAVMHDVLHLRNNQTWFPLEAGSSSPEASIATLYTRASSIPQGNIHRIQSILIIPL